MSLYRIVLPVLVVCSLILAGCKCPSCQTQRQCPAPGLQEQAGVEESPEKSAAAPHPTISRMAEGARAAELLRDFSQELLLEGQLAQKKADALAEQARAELYHANQPPRAAALAADALQLDPGNRSARRLLTEARARLSDESARHELVADTLISTARVQHQSLLQQYLSLRERASELMKQKKYAEAAEELRRAKRYLEALSSYEPVRGQRETGRQTDQTTG
jgi:hypothetical protein